MPRSPIKRSQHGSGKNAGIATHAFAFVWLIPALAINLDWTLTGRVDWNIGAAFSVAAVAVIVESLRHIRGRLCFALALGFGCALFLANIANGFRNAVTRSGDASDHARGEIEAARIAADSRRRLTVSRLIAVKIAGEEPVSSYSASIEEMKARESARWLATGGCNASGGIKGGITAPESQTFCASLQDLARKLGAAEQRDQIDRQLSALDLRRPDAATPSAADPFAERAAEIVPIRPAAIRLLFDTLWAVLPELVAAIMPALTLWLVSLQTTPQPIKPSTASSSTPATSEPSAVISDPFGAFVAAMLEPCQGARLAPGEAMRLWEAFCAERGLELKSQRWLGLRLGQAFAVDERHKRKVYMNVQAKLAHTVTQ